MIEITMPKAGQSMEDGTIVQWRKAEGDAVAEGDILLEVETDKAVVEVEAADSGTLRKILVGAGETVDVHTPIALLGEPDEDISQAVARYEPAGTAEGGDPAKPESPARSGAGSSEAPSPAAESPAEPPGGVTPVVMPKAGQSVEEATIVKWNISPGDKIAEGDVIFEIETDKATVEVEATDAGRLSRIVADEGETVEVLEPVAYLSEDDEKVEQYLQAVEKAKPAGPPAETPAAQPAAPATAPQAVPQPQPPAAPQAGAPTTESGRVKASPAARKIAAQRGVDIGAIGAGSGPGGRILSTDVEKAPAAAAVAPQAPPPAPASAAVPGQVTRRKMPAMRKAIARNLTASKQQIPHFYMKLTVDAEGLETFYRGEKARYRCSINDVVTLAVARTLREFPAFRSRIDGDQIVEFPTANIGIAVGMDNGLVVPVVVGAGAMTLQQLAGETRRLVEAARGGSIENMGQGVLTITNLGMFGVEEFSGIINPPEASILAVGALREEVIVRGGTMRPGKVMTLTMSADHRIVDGLIAAKFMGRLKELLELPQLLTR